MKNKRAIDKRSYEGTAPVRLIPVPTDTGPAGAARKTSRDRRDIVPALKGAILDLLEWQDEAVRLRRENDRIRTAYRRVRRVAIVGIAVMAAGLAYVIVQVVR